MLLTRRSVKRFAPDSLPSVADLQRIADAGANAPTGRGRQSPFIVVVTDRTVRDQLSRLNAEILGRDGDPFYGAPVVMVVLADRAHPTYLYDGSLVMGNLLNAAHALGWGACWIHRAHEMFDRPRGKPSSPNGASTPTSKASAFVWSATPNTSPRTPHRAKKTTSVSSDYTLFHSTSPHRLPTAQLTSVHECGGDHAPPPPSAHKVCSPTTARGSFRQHVANISSTMRDGSP